MYSQLVLDNQTVLINIEYTDKPGLTLKSALLQDSILKVQDLQNS